MRVALPGGSDKLGRACVHDLGEHGHKVVNLNVRPHRENLCPHVRPNLRVNRFAGRLRPSFAHLSRRTDLPGAGDGT